MQRLFTATRGVLVLIVPILTGFPITPVAAQEVALADRGPRFLFARTSVAEPVEVDARSHATLRRVVSLNFERPTVGTLLAAIERQTGVRFAYKGKLVSEQQPVALRADAITVAAALTAILAESEVDVLLSGGRQITLVKRRPRPVVRVPGSVAGRVTDAGSGTALEGAEVLLEGTSRRVLTDPAGEYRMRDVEPGTYRAVARRIGYASQSQPAVVSDGQETTVNFSLQPAPTRLDQLVVTGTITPTEVKSLPSPISVITSEEIEQQNVARVDQLFRGQIPGAIAFDMPSTDYYSTIAVRGTNAFGNNNIKTYVDGVEVALPSFIATIDPKSIERIEVIRGPQASVVYGSDASSGVMQIFTKKGRAGLARPQVALQAAVGLGQKNGPSGTNVGQDVSGSVSSGSDQFTYHIGGSFVNSGEWTPEYYSRTASAFAGARHMVGDLTTEVSARYNRKAFGWPWQVTLRDAGYQAFSRPPNEEDNLEQATIGVRLSYAASAAWEHVLMLGHDRSAYEYYNREPKLTTPADTFLTVYTSNATKTSIGYNTTLRVNRGRPVAGAITAGVDRYHRGSVNTFTAQATRHEGTVDGSSSHTRSPFDNTGLFGQLQLGLWDAAFVTAGVRAEWNDNFGENYGAALSPRLGVAIVRSLGDVTAKVRASYGSGIKPPLPHQTAPAVGALTIQLAAPGLGPERQKGGDIGLELVLGDRASFGMSYYDQTAVDLIDRVRLGDSAGKQLYQNQNVGEIKNKGWEFEGRLNLGQVDIAGTYSITDSRVKTLSPTYTGALIIGDRLFAIPANAAGATVSYRPLPGTSITGRLTRLGGWMENDLLARYAVLYGGQPARPPREYFMEYPSVTKISLGASQNVTEELGVFMHIDNVGNNRRAERYNIDIPRGRVVTLGARFSH